MRQLNTKRVMVTEAEGSPEGETSPTARPEIDVSRLPPKLARYFRDRGENLILDSASEKALLTKSLLSQHPVLVEELPAEQREAMVREARSYNFRQAPDGTLRMADCLLASQPEDARIAHKADADGRWALQADPDYGRKMLEQEARRNPAARGALHYDALTGELGGSAPPLSEFVGND